MAKKLKKIRTHVEHHTIPKTQPLKPSETSANAKCDTPAVATDLTAAQRVWGILKLLEPILLQTSSAIILRSAQFVNRHWRYMVKYSRALGARSFRTPYLLPAQELSLKLRLVHHSPVNARQIQFVRK